MFLLHASNGLSRKLQVFSSFFGNGEPLSRYLHSFQRRNSSRRSHFVYGKGKRSLKPHQVQNVGTYMRGFVGRISNILRYCSWDAAKDSLESLSIKWDSFTVNQVLKTHPPMEKAWLFFNWASSLRGFKHDQFTYTTMLDIFGEARRISSMKHVFQLMQEKEIKIDVVTYTSLLHWLSNDGDIDGAMKMWEEMRDSGCRPTAVSYTAYMKVLFSHGRPVEAIRVYKEMCESGCSPTCYTYTILMEHLIDSGKCESALEIFSKMQEIGVQPDKAACNILIEKCSKVGATRTILEILHHMRENFLVLRYPVYIQALEALKIGGESDLLLQQVNPHVSVVETSSNDSEFVASDLSLATDEGLVLHFLSKRNFIAVDKIICSIMGSGNTVKLDPELVSTIIKSSCTQGREDSALLALDYSLKMGVDVDEVALCSMIGLFMRNCDFAKTVQIFESMAKRKGKYLEIEFVSLLIYRLGTSQQLDHAVKIFDLLPEELMNKTSIYTAVILAYLSAKNVEKGIEMFERMKSVGVGGCTGTYNALISGLEKCGRSDLAKPYVKDKKRFQARCNESEKLVGDQRLCDLLFSGLYVS